MQRRGPGVDLSVSALTSHGPLLAFAPARCRALPVLVPAPSPGPSPITRSASGVPMPVTPQQLRCLVQRRPAKSEGAARGQRLALLGAEEEPGRRSSSDQT